MRVKFECKILFKFESYLKTKKTWNLIRFFFFRIHIWINSELDLNFRRHARETCRLHNSLNQSWLEVRRCLLWTKRSHFIKARRTSNTNDATVKVLIRGALLSHGSWRNENFRTVTYLITNRFVGRGSHIQNSPDTPGCLGGDFHRPDSLVKTTPVVPL